MSIKSSALFASRMLFPKGSKNTVGTKSITGAIICIALSLIPLVVVLSVSDGMIEGITERIINLSSSHITAEVSFYDEDKIDKYEIDRVLEKVKTVDKVTSCYELISATGLAASTKARCGATIRAVETDVFEKIDSYKTLFKCVEGNISDFAAEPKSALIGKGISEKLNIKPGDTIRLITTQKLGNKVLPKMTPFKVRAIISSGYQELDSLWVFIPIEEGIKILTPTNSTSSVMIETENPFDQLFYTQNKIEEALDYDVLTFRWDEVNKSQYENFSSTKVLLIFIMLLIVLVASVNISSCLVMLSMERRKEIAILKSFGTNPKTISWSFIFTGLGIGACGILIGIPLGILISVNVNGIIWFIEKIVNLFAELFYLIANGNLNSFYTIHLMDEAYYLETIPVTIPFKQIMLYIVITLVLSLLASLVPALKAGKEKPIETFRKAGR